MPLESRKPPPGRTKRGGVVSFILLHTFARKSVKKGSDYVIFVGNDVIGSGNDVIEMPRLDPLLLLCLFVGLLRRERDVQRHPEPVREPLQKPDARVARPVLESADLGLSDPGPL